MGLNKRFVPADPVAEALKKKYPSVTPSASRTITRLPRAWSLVRPAEELLGNDEKAAAARCEVVDAAMAAIEKHKLREINQMSALVCRKGRLKKSVWGHLEASRNAGLRMSKEEERAVFTLLLLLRWAEAHPELAWMTVAYAGKRVGGASGLIGMLVAGNMPLVYGPCVTAMKRPYAPGIEDLWSDAAASLLKAVMAFDPAYGWKFSTYAMRVIVLDLGRAAHVRYLVDSRAVHLSTTVARRDGSGKASGIDGSPLLSDFVRRSATIGERISQDGGGDRSEEWAFARDVCLLLERPELLHAMGMRADVARAMSLRYGRREAWRESDRMIADGHATLREVGAELGLTRSRAQQLCAMGLEEMAAAKADGRLEVALEMLRAETRGGGVSREAEVMRLRTGKELGVSEAEFLASFEAA